MLSLCSILIASFSHALPDFSNNTDKITALHFICLMRLEAVPPERKSHNYKTFQMHPKQMRQ